MPKTKASSKKKGGKQPTKAKQSHSKGQHPCSSQKQPASDGSDNNRSNEEYEVHSAQSHKKAKCAVEVEEVEDNDESDKIEEVIRSDDNESDEYGNGDDKGCVSINH